MYTFSVECIYYVIVQITQDCCKFKLGDPHFHNIGPDIEDVQTTPQP